MPTAIQIHHVLRAALEKVDRALLDLTRWRNDCHSNQTSEIRGQCGGDLRSFGGTYTELVPNAFVKRSD